jgi:hypothetical protein
MPRCREWKQNLIARKKEAGMENMRKLAIAIIIVGLICLAIGIVGKFTGSSFAGFSPRGFGLATGICFLLSINLLLLDKKP